MRPLTNHFPSDAHQLIHEACTAFRGFITPRRRVGREGGVMDRRGRNCRGAI
jgi:hypothetical protein